MEIKGGVKQKEESDSEAESFPRKQNKYSASLASTSCGNSPPESDTDSDSEEDYQDKVVNELRESYKTIANKYVEINDNNDMPSTCIARSVGKDELTSSEKALKAMYIE